MISKFEILMCVLIQHDECNGVHIHSMTLEEFVSKHIHKARYHLRTKFKGLIKPKEKVPKLLMRMYVKGMKRALKLNCKIPIEVLNDNQFRAGLLNDVRKYANRNKLRLGKMKTTN